MQQFLIMEKFDRNKDSIGFLVGKTSRAMKNCLNHLFAAHGYRITIDQWHVLLMLWMQNGLTQHELTQKLDKDKTTAARIIENLVKRNYIVKIRDKNDKRNNLVYLTRKGEEIEEKLMPIAHVVQKQSIKGISDDELETLSKIIEKIYKNVSHCDDEMLHIQQNNK